MTWVGWLLWVPLAVVLGAREVGVEAGPLAIAVALTPWCVAAMIVPLVLGLLTRTWWLVAAAALLLAAGAMSQVPVLTAEPSSAVTALTVASVNATFGRVDADEVVALVEGEGVDILAVQELTPEAAEALVDAGLEEVLPSAVVAAEEGFAGIGLWSSMAIADVDEPLDTTARTLRAEVETDDGVLTVYAAHPAAPGPTAHAAWSADLAELSAALTTEDGPVLLLGDLNATRDHVALRDLEGAGYADAADDAGAGWRFTFPQGRGPMPFVAIDHAMARGVPWVASALATVALPGADHRALVVDYATR